MATDSLEQSIKTTTEKFVKSYVVACEKKDASHFSADLTPDCRRHIGPPSFLTAMGAPPDFSFDNAGYEQIWLKELPHYSANTYEIFNLVIDTKNLKSACRSTFTGDFSDGSKGERNLVFFLDFTSDGSKISNIYQVNDVEEAKNYRFKVEGLMGEKTKIPGTE
jgi:hypothetical protein